MSLKWRVLVLVRAVKTVTIKLLYCKTNVTS